jgi:hypothetical protein
MGCKSLIKISPKYWTLGLKGDLVVMQDNRPLIRYLPQRKAILKFLKESGGKRKNALYVHEQSFALLLAYYGSFQRSFKLLEGEMGALARILNTKAANIRVQAWKGP